MSACSSASFRVTIVDNSYGQEISYFENLKLLIASHSLDIYLHKSSSNIGFGCANNLAFNLVHTKHSFSDFILVLNPDVFVSFNSLNNALTILSNHSDFGLLLPRFKSDSGQDLFLSKRYPSIWILFLRGFGPVWLKKLFQSAIDEYDLKDLPPDKSHQESTVGSGACFFIRTNIWKSLDGFDSRFFLYFEDFDLIYRAKKITNVAYEPSVEVVHLGGHTSKKGIVHIKYFFRSAWHFFIKNGWKFL